MSETAVLHKPRSVDELADIVAAAGTAGQHLLVRGGGTHQAFANLAEPTDAIVETTGMNAVIDYSPVDLTLAVHAGATLAEIDATLRKQGQRLAVDAPCREEATIGGLFATGLSGPSRFRYGGLKDAVIGAEVLNGDGVVTKSGGMVVKNVSGFELARLHYGAHGAFGIVTRLNLKVLPLPESRRELQVTFEAVEPCMEAGTHIVTSNLDPTAVFATGGLDSSWVLHIVVEGFQSFVDAQMQRVERAVVSKLAVSDVRAEELLGAALPAYEAIADLTNADGQIVCRLSVPALRQSDVLASIPNLVSRSVLADLGSGLVYLRCEAGTDELRTVRSLELGAVFLALPDSLKTGLDVFGDADPGAAAVLRRLKAEFDPRGVFNRGRFALGL